MLVLIRLFPKGGLGDLWETLEREKRNLFWEDIEPLYAIQLEGKRYITIGLNVKNLESVQKVFLKNLQTMASVRKTQTIPIMTPAHFDVPEKISSTMDRFVTFVRVDPENYDHVYKEIVKKGSEGGHLRYISYSFGDDDIIVQTCNENRGAVEKFAKGVLGKIDGVMAYETRKVVKYMRLQTPEKAKKHWERFAYNADGKLRNPDLYEKYLKEKSTMTVIVRLFAKKDLSKLWEFLEKNIQKYETKDVVPLYASQQENRNYISVIFETANFEVLKEFLINNISTMENVRKTRTIPLLEPTYFLLPKTHPKDLERYLFLIRVNPAQYSTVRNKIINFDFPENLFISYLSYSLGEDDILLSVLTDTKKSAQRFAKKALDRMPGVNEYDMSNQLRTMRLAAKARWKQHHNKFLSSFDKAHKKDYDSRYDWTDEFREYAAMTGAFVNEMDR